MSTNRGLVTCLVLGCMGLLSALTVARGTPSTGVLADAAVPAPTFPAGLYLPIVCKALTPSPTPTPTITPGPSPTPTVTATPLPNPRVVIEHSEYQEVWEDQDCFYAELRNLTGRRIRITDVTVRAGQQVTLCGTASLPIYVFNYQRTAPFALRVSEPDVPLTTTLTVDVSWRFTDEELLDLDILDWRYVWVDTGCVPGGDDTWCVVKVRNNTDRLVPNPYLVVTLRSRYANHLYVETHDMPSCQAREEMEYEFLLERCGNIWDEVYNLWAVCYVVPNCTPSSRTRHSVAFPAQSGVFSAEFDVIPNRSDVEGVIGLSSGGASRSRDLGALVWWENSGYFHARDGDECPAGERMYYGAGRC